jgi:hypothetical protein
MGKDKRIRIAKTEYLELQASGVLAERFALTENIQFDLKIFVDRANLNSAATAIAGGISIAIGAKDFENLSSASTSKKGILVGDFLIQVDIWDAARRA